MAVGVETVRLLGEQIAWVGADGSYLGAHMATYDKGGSVWLRVRCLRFRLT